MSDRITIDSILWAYRLLLNREPENLDIIQEKLTRLKTNQELVRELLTSAEFANNQQELCSGLMLSLLGSTLEALGRSIKTSANSPQSILSDLLETSPKIENHHQQNLKPKENIQTNTLPQFSSVENNIQEVGKQLKIAHQQETNLIAKSPCLKIKHNLPKNSYLVLRDNLPKEQKANKIINSYKQWIEKEYLIEHKNRLIYCPIAKNACTLFKDVLLENSDYKYDYRRSNLKMHKYIDNNRDKFTLKRFAYLNEAEYFKFIILRDPFKRLVSTYGDKFVKRLNKNDAHATPVINQVYQHFSLKPDYETSITFSQFVDYLLRFPDYQLDTHWRSQSVWFAPGLVKFDYIGQFERLDLVISYLEQKLKIKIDPTVSKHRINYDNDNSHNKYHDWYPWELNRLPSFPQSAEFYTPEIEAKVRVKYAQDIAIYEQNFQTKLNAFTS